MPEGIYTYVENDPLMYFDSLGLASEEDPLEPPPPAVAEALKELAQRQEMERELKQSTSPAEPYYGNAFGPGEFGPTGECKASGSDPQVGPPGFSGSKGYQLSNPAYQPRRNQPGSIGDLDYSGHALDQMQNRGFVPSVVSNAVENGTPFDAGNGATGYYDAINNITVITNSQTGRVVTVRPGAP